MKFNMMMVILVLVLGSISTVQALPMMRMHQQIMMRPSVEGVFSPMEKLCVTIRHPESGIF